MWKCEARERTEDYLKFLAWTTWWVAIPAILKRDTGLMSGLRWQSRTGFSSAWSSHSWSCDTQLWPVNIGCRKKRAYQGKWNSQHANVGSQLLFVLQIKQNATPFIQVITGLLSQQNSKLSLRKKSSKKKKDAMEIISKRVQLLSCIKINFSWSRYYSHL